MWVSFSIVGISAPLEFFGIVLGDGPRTVTIRCWARWRSAAQLVSYETAAGMAIVGRIAPCRDVVDTREIIEAQNDYGVWFAFAAPVGFLVYICGVHRGDQIGAPVRFAGKPNPSWWPAYMTEYRRVPPWAPFIFSRNIQTWVVVGVDCPPRCFLGGWLRPFLPDTAAFNVLDYFPSVLMLGVGDIAFYSRRPKQPVKVQKPFYGGRGALLMIFCRESF